MRLTDLNSTLFKFIVVPEGSKELLSELPGVKTLEVTAKYPFAEGLSPNNNLLNNAVLVTEILRQGTFLP